MITQGDLFKLYVNGVLVDEVRDDSFSGGRVGLLAGGCIVPFDDFYVTEVETATEPLRKAIAY